MFDGALNWLEKKWWGLIIAHLIILAVTYLGIWQVTEPLGFPDTFSTLPTLARIRGFFHVILTLLIAAYITLALDLFLRRKRWASARNLDYGWLIIGTWKGEYENKKSKKRQATLELYQLNDELKAEIHISTDQGIVIQKATVSDHNSNIAFNLLTTDITTAAERITKWRPEMWRCKLLKDSQGHEQITAEINDTTTSGIDRIITTFNLYRIN